MTPLLIWEDPERTPEEDLERFDPHLGIEPIDFEDDGEEYDDEPYA